MKPENIANNNIKVIGLIDVMTAMLNDYKADLEVKFYVEVGNDVGRSVKRICNGRMSDITFGDLATALAMNGYCDLTSVMCRVTTFDNDDMMVITIL